MVRVYREQQGRPERQKRDNLLGHVLAQGISFEAVQIRRDFEMQEPIGKRRRHVEHRRPVFLAVPRRPDKPAVGNHVRADTPVQNKLLGDPLQGRRGHVQLIQKQNPRA